MASGKTQSPPAVDRAFAVLELLARSQGLTLNELQQQLGIPKSSLHSLLVGMERRGYLRRNVVSGRYVFGLKLFSLSNMALCGLDLRQASARFLIPLMQRTRLTVHMAVLESDEAVLIEKIDPSPDYRLATWMGKRMDLHCTGVGKALMACLPGEHVDRIIQERGLPRHNENTIISARRLKADLEQTRKRGYSIDDEEDEIGLRCIGTPVSCPGADVLAAISLAGTIAQITPENEQSLALELRDTAARISAHLSEAAPQSDDGRA